MRHWWILKNLLHRYYDVIYSYSYILIRTFLFLHSCSYISIRTFLFLCSYISIRTFLFLHFYSYIPVSIFLFVRSYSCIYIHTKIADGNIRTDLYYTCLNSEIKKKKKKTVLSQSSLKKVQFCLQTAET